MIKPINPDVSMAADVQGLAGLKRAAHDGQPSAETLKQVASQFESLFMQMMLKSMREASFGDDLFGSEQSNFYRDMYDQQLSMTLAKKQGMGLADVLVRQLGGDRLMTAVTGENAKDSGALTLERLHALAPTKNSTNNATNNPGTANPASFVRALWPQAERAANDLGVAPEAIVTVAALETGWGSAVMQRPDGRSANNLFGIKADDQWQGERVTASTHEFENGNAVTRRETFRAYDSVADSVNDFARFLKDNPRYREALASGADAQAFVASLGRNGYATDPTYAHKLASILAGDTLRTALSDVSGRTSVAGATGLKIPAERPIPT
jgi:flagellar protein FlgJ